MIVNGLFTLLSNDAAISALVSTRIYPLGMPQNVQYPCLMYVIDEQQAGST